MPQSGVTSDDSWYLTSFVILAFYYLSFALLLSTLKNTIHFNSQWRIPYVFWCIFSCKRRVLVLCRSAMEYRSAYDLAAIFRIRQTFILNFTTWLFSRTHGIDENDLIAYRQSGFNSSVHWTAPPSPKFPEEFCRGCSLG